MAAAAKRTASSVAAAALAASAAISGDETNAAGKALAEAVDRGAPKAIRIKSRRPAYRRGGQVWSDTEFVDINPRDYEPAQALAVLDDPVLILQGEYEDGWALIPAEIRSGMADLISADLNDTAED